MPEGYNFDAKLKEFLAKPVDYTRYLHQRPPPQDNVGTPATAVRDKNPVDNRPGANESGSGSQATARPLPAFLDHTIPFSGSSQVMTTGTEGVPQWLTTSLESSLTPSQRAAFLKDYGSNLDNLFNGGVDPAGGSKTVAEWVEAWKQQSSWTGYGSRSGSTSKRFKLSKNGRLEMNTSPAKKEGVKTSDSINSLFINDPAMMAARDTSAPLLYGPAAGVGRPPDEGSLIR